MTTVFCPENHIYGEWYDEPLKNDSLLPWMDTDCQDRVHQQCYEPPIEDPATDVLFW